MQRLQVANVAAASGTRTAGTRRALPARERNIFTPLGWFWDNSVPLSPICVFSADVALDRLSTHQYLCPPCTHL